MPTRLTCEYLTNPLGLDEPRPRFAWQPPTTQKAYQLVVRCGGADVWNSGQVATDASTHIEYDGPALRPRHRYEWQVRTWDDADHPSPWSQMQWFETGHMGLDGWKPAQWIGPADDGGDPIYTLCPLLQKTFHLKASPARARLYITAKGIYEATINGQAVTPDVLTPGFTDPRKRIHYRVYDVTSLLAAGGNTLDVCLGNGWYCSHVANWRDPTEAIYGTRPRLLAQLIIDGQMCISSDDSWQMTLDGPRRSADIFRGETYDARLADLRDAKWTTPVAQPLGEVPLLAHPAQPVRRIMEIKPTAMTKAKAPGSTGSTGNADSYIFDLGQNMVGWVRLNVAAPAGTTVTLRHGEALQKDGTLYTANLRSASSIDRYTFQCAVNETFEPRFTFHGFRYVEVTGLAATPGLDAITGIVVHNNMPVTGSFECSHALINKLQSNIQWGQRGNFLEVPTDCPQRNERQGWMGDAQVFAATASFNMDVAAFFTKWIGDVLDAQQPDGRFPDIAPDTIGRIGAAAWADAGVIVPWTMYVRYGDTRVLKRCFPAIARFIAYCERASVDLIGPYTGYGDWLNIDAFTPLDLISTAYFAHSTDLTARIAAVLDKDDDAARYRQLHARIKAAFNRQFVTPSGRVVGDTQTAYVLALHFDLLPAEKREAALCRLAWDIHEGRSAVWPYPARKDHLSTGFVGCRDLPYVLSDNGRADVAYQLLLTETYPSWLFPVKNGATTIWERWNSWTPDHGFGDDRMNSFNHYAYGAIGQWMYERMAGLSPDEAMPGYKRALIRPLPGAPADKSITRASAAYDSIHGRYESAWRFEGEKFILDVNIPPNCTATVTLPDGSTHEAAAGRHRYAC